MKEMSRNDLLKRVDELEKKVAELEGRVQEQPKEEIIEELNKRICLSSKNII